MHMPTVRPMARPAAAARARGSQPDFYNGFTMAQHMESLEYPIEIMKWS